MGLHVNLYGGHVVLLIFLTQVSGDIMHIKLAMFSLLALTLACDCENQTRSKHGSEV